MKKIAAVLVVIAAAILAGCVQTVREEPRLVVRASRGSPAVTAELVGVRARLFIWHWGDGTQTETTVPYASHTYAVLDVYTITVECVRDVPEIGAPPDYRGTVVATYTATIDIRPAISITGLVVTVVVPPPWYDPQTWPANHYPSACDLRIHARLLVLDPNVRPLSYHWQMWQGGRFILGSNEPEFAIPGEAFLATGGCPPPPTPYTVRVVVLTSDGGVLEHQEVIWATPPR